MDFIFIVWFIGVIACFIIEFNPRVREKINDYIVAEQVFYIFYNKD